jgi:hypothetical protein
MASAESFFGPGSRSEQLLQANGKAVPAPSAALVVLRDTPQTALGSSPPADQSPSLSVADIRCWLSVAR